MSGSVIEDFRRLLELQSHQHRLAHRLARDVPGLSRTAGDASLPWRQRISDRALISQAEAAHILGITPRTVNRWAAAGHLTKVGPRITTDSLLDYLESDTA